MKQNGEAIYGTTASPFSNQLVFGRVTSKPGRLYLHVFDWPRDGDLRVPLAGATVNRVYLLANPKDRLQFISDQKGTTLHLPANAPDPIASVVVIETSK
jgi:alpha-L-fucosidase